MIDYTNRDDIYNSLKLAANDNAKTFTLAQDIRSTFSRIKQSTIDQINKEREQGRIEGLDSLGMDSTDAELRAGARMVLINKLKSGEITAAEFAQFKDVFGLANASDQISVECVSYADTVAVCPACGVNVYEARGCGADGDAGDESSGSGGEWSEFGQ